MVGRSGLGREGRLVLLLAGRWRRRRGNGGRRGGHRLRALHRAFQRGFLLGGRHRCGLGVSGWGGSIKRGLFYLHGKWRIRETRGYRR